MKNFEVSNDSLRSRHPNIFKNEDFDFCPTNDLVKSMPFNFVNGLVDGKWTNLDNKWLKDVKYTLKQAQSNSVKDIVFVRTIMKDDMTGSDLNLINNDKEHIYQVTMDNNAQSTFYVNSALIMDIIGEEEGMKGELICICNIASGRKVSLTWGSKKKLSNSSHLSIGDDVIVSNRGTKWEHRAKIIQMNDISSTQTCYDHVIVIWNGIVIDYESMYTFPLTEESLRLVCGANTIFQKVTSGYRLFPPKNLRKKVNELQVTDWGITEFYKRDDNRIRGYFLL